jgi:hypothetical protein
MQQAPHDRQGFSLVSLMRSSWSEDEDAMVARRCAAGKGGASIFNANDNDSRLLHFKTLIQFVAFRKTFKNNIYDHDENHDHQP